MFLNKIKSRTSGILIYGISPPKIHTPEDKIREIAQKTHSIIGHLDIDALVVYDVQDESARTNEERPFPFVSALDPFDYASRHLQQFAVPKIIYRPAGKYTTEELAHWLQNLRSHGFFPVFVGLPSPDYVVKTSLKDAYGLWRDNHEAHSLIGAVVIPERHAILKDEDVRILDKTDSGVSFFISQCVFNAQITCATLEALVKACKAGNKQIPTIIFTLTICGSLKTLQFLDWLGIHIPEATKADLAACENPVTRSVEIATGIATELIHYCKEHSIPFGFNIESVSVRKEEVAASLELFQIIEGLLKANGFRS